MFIRAGGGGAVRGSPAGGSASRDLYDGPFVGLDQQGPVQFHYPGPTVEQDFGVEVGP